MKDFNKKWWFRLIIIFYVVIGLSGISLVVLGIIDQVPRFSAYTSTYTFKCNDGYTKGEFKYGINETITSSSIYSINKNDYFYFNDPFMNSFTRALCADVKEIRNVVDQGTEEEKLILLNDIKNGNYSEFLPANDNFIIVTKDVKYFGSWKETILWGILYLTIFCVSMIVIRYVFLYILTGKHKLVFNEIKKKF